MRNNWFSSGKWNAICDVCGFKRKSVELIDRWDGLKVCMPSVSPGCWELRHPQDLIRPIPDQTKLPWTKPESKDQFIVVDLVDATDTFTCTPLSMLAQADYGTADCATVGNINGGLIP